MLAYLLSLGGETLYMLGFCRGNGGAGGAVSWCSWSLSGWLVANSLASKSIRKGESIPPSSSKYSYQWSVYAREYSKDRLNAWANHPWLDNARRRRKKKWCQKRRWTQCGWWRPFRDSGFPIHKEHLFPRMEGRLNWSNCHVVLSFRVLSFFSLQDPLHLFIQRCLFATHRSIAAYPSWQDMLRLVTSTRPPPLTDIPGFFSRWTNPTIIQHYPCHGDDPSMLHVIWTLSSLFSWQILVKVSPNVKSFNGRYSSYTRVCVSEWER